MIKRPRRGETEEDILRMQQEFLAERAKNPSISPAAKFVKVEKAPKKSLFAQSRERNVTVSLSNTTAGLYREENTHSQDLYGEIHDKIVGSNPNNEITDIILGDIIEKKVEEPKAIVNKESSNKPTAFPQVQRGYSAIKLQGVEKGKSLFAHSLDREFRKSNPEIADVPMDCTEDSINKPIESEKLTQIFGSSSVLVEDEKSADTIHKENLEILSKMGQEEILAERKKLLDSIDPTLVALLAKRRREKMNAMNVNYSETIRLDNTENESLKSPPLDLPSSIVATELLERSAAEKWIHFDIVEKDKFEWMREISTHAVNLKAGEKFEARFDWKGVLLPYSLENKESMPKVPKSSAQKDERELYLHGEEPHRPGYTLQELFRLARSTVLQQRISAFGAVAGILNIYNQGFYDNVLDLPIIKIFFLLRFGFDDNSLTTLEIVSKALAYLFYNETDETLLDFIYDNPGCQWQPIIKASQAQRNTDDSISVENLQVQLQMMKINAESSCSSIAARVDESEEESRASMSDFQLAETDLIDCFLRTNILQRIFFVLNTVRPDNSTVSSCLKLLIRIARSGKAEAMQIINNEELMKCLIENFLPGLEKVDTASTTIIFYNYPQNLCLKLLRILISQNLEIALKLINWNILNKLQNYLYSRDDLKGQLIKVQIESLRILRCLLLLRVDNTLYKKFLPAFRYMLQWHLNHNIYEEGGPVLIKQHAAALLAAITSVTCNIEIASTLGQALNDCCCSWFHKATKNGITEFSQATLLSACLNVVTWYLRNYDCRERFDSFLDKYLCNFIVSETFVRFVGTLQSSSIVLRPCASHDRRSIITSLPNVGSVLISRFGPQLILPQTYCILLLNTLWRLLELPQLPLHIKRVLLDLLIQPQIVEPLVQYLKTLATRTNRYLATNFFAKTELRLIYSFLCFDGFFCYLQKSEILQVSYNFLCCLTAEYIPEIEHLFKRIIFNREFIDAEESVLEKWRLTCLELVYPHYIVVPPNELTLSLANSRAPLLPKDWPYFQLKIILHNYIENVKQKSKLLLSERDIIYMTLSFVSLLEECNPHLEIVDPTEKLMYLMITFMGPDSQFLESEMSLLLHKHIRNFYDCYKDYTFQFDAVYEGKCKFENLYALFVDHFQAASYGDELFGSLVLVPLAQKYDNKWRRRLWSDYAAALRFLDCNENLLMGGLKAYLEPPEEEESLLKAYAVALNTNLVRPNTIPYKIAQYHVSKFKERTNK